MEGLTSGSRPAYKEIEHIFHVRAVASKNAARDFLKSFVSEQLEDFDLRVCKPEVEEELAALKSRFVVLRASRAARLIVEDIEKDLARVQNQIAAYEKDLACYN